MAPVESTTPVGAQTGAEPLGNPRIRPEVVCALDFGDQEVPVPVDDFERPFGLPEIPGISDREVTPREDLITNRRPSGSPGLTVPTSKVAWSH